MRGWMGERESALSTFADDRAATVARQFQWAVEELSFDKVNHLTLSSLVPQRTRAESAPRVGAASVAARDETRERSARDAASTPLTR